MKFTIREIVENVRRKMNNADEERLYRAAKRLEFRIAEINNKKPPDDLLPENEISVPEFSDMYETYLLQEANLEAEDWDCYSSYGQIFNQRWKEYLETIVRNNPSPRKQFTDWRW